MKTKLDELEIELRAIEIAKKLGWHCGRTIC